MSEHHRYSVGGREAVFEPVTVPEWLIDVVFEQERAVLEDLLSVLRREHVFYDIGANYGLYTGFGGQVVTEGTVVAFEPYPPNVAALERTVEINGLSNAAIYDVALSSTSGSREFAPPQSERFATATFTSDGDHPESFHVRTVRADDFIAEQNIPAPSVVKIDVEGAEPVVLDGMESLLEREGCRHVFCELHPPDEDAAHVRSIADYGSSVDEIVDRFESWGYEVDLSTREGQLHLWARS